MKNFKETFTELINSELNEKSSSKLLMTFTDDVIRGREITFKYTVFVKDHGEISGTKTLTTQEISDLGGATKMWDNEFIIRLINRDKSALNEYQKFLINETYRYTFDIDSLSGSRIKDLIVDIYYKKYKYAPVEIKSLTYKKHQII